MPAPTIAGVFGMARMTEILQPAASSMALVLTEAAKEIRSLPGLSAGAIPLTTSCIC